MKKKNLILLTLICLISLCLFSGLLVYAFDRQVKRDMKEQNQEEMGGTDLSPTATPELTPTPSAVPTQPGASEEDSEPEVTPEATVTPVAEKPSEPIVLGFAGDVNLDESYAPAAKYDSEDKDITACFSQDLLDEMKLADIMMINNEFAYSDRGKKTPDKSYNFRAKPERVQILKEMGVDIVSLANNHALDYGPDALLDTFDTLDKADIDYIGAGENLDRAKAPIYYTIGGKKIAYIAATHVIPFMDWYASENGLGMVGTYDPTLILESIKEAKENSDYIIIYVHWGKERNTRPEQYQRNLATYYIDAGADAVIGCHPHVMQGLEFYKGKPIAYSLGNYWFNNSTRESGMLKLYLDPDDSVRVQLLPVMNKDTVTYLLTGDQEKKSYFDMIEGLSYDVEIDDNGFITEAE